MELAQAVYGLCNGMDAQHRYGLASQLQKSAVSVPSNIAEGNARRSTADYARFVSIASGSNAELQTQLLLAAALKLGPPEDIDKLLTLTERVGQMLTRLHESLTSRVRSESRVPSAESR